MRYGTANREFFKIKILKFFKIKIMFQNFSLKKLFLSCNIVDKRYARNLLKTARIFWERNIKKQKFLKKSSKLIIFYNAVWCFYAVTFGEHKIYDNKNGVVAGEKDQM